MTTLNTLRADIRATMLAYSNNSLIDNRHIDDMIAEKRVKYIRREYNRNRTIDQALVQDLGCVEVELVDRVQCGCYEIDSGCKILRTKSQIPLPIQLYGKDTITRVASLDILDLNIHYTDYQAAIYSGNGRFNKKSLTAFLKNNYMHFIIKTPEHLLLEKVNIQGIFSDPKEAGRFSTCEGEVCWHPDSHYPLSEWMWDIIKGEIIQELLPMYQIKPDKQNNGKDDAMLLNNVKPRQTQDED